jgi:HAMP domain-containing protein
MIVLILSAIALVALLALCLLIAASVFFPPTSKLHRKLQSEHNRIAKIQALKAELDRLLNS